MEVITKHWSITLMTALSIVGLTSLTVGMITHADMMSMGLIVTMTGVSVQLVKSHFAAEEAKQEVIAAAKRLADDALAKAERLEAQLLVDTEKAAIEREKTKNAIVAVVHKQEEIKSIVQDVKEKVNGGHTVEIIKVVAELMGSTTQLTPIPVTVVAQEVPVPIINVGDKPGG